MYADSCGKASLRLSKHRQSTATVLLSCCSVVQEPLLLFFINMDAPSLQERAKGTFSAMRKLRVSFLSFYCTHLRFFAATRFGTCVIACSRSRSPLGPALQSSKNQQRRYPTPNQTSPKATVQMSPLGRPPRFISPL